MHFLKSILVVVTLLVSQPLIAGIVASEDFSGGATGWSADVTTFILGNEVMGGYNQYGAGASTQKTFTLSGTQSQVTIDFDFWKGDSWDTEYFQMYVNGVLQISDPYIHYPGYERGRSGLAGTPGRL